MSLATNYLGLVLRNPIVASSSPLSHSVDSIRRLEDAGASAVVMYSLFEEQITFDSFYLDHYLRSNVNSFAESVSFFPEMNEYNVWPDEYLNLIRRQASPSGYVSSPHVTSFSDFNSAGQWIWWRRRPRSSTGCFAEATTGPPINRRAQTLFKPDLRIVAQS